jgi:hypothetical protein
MDRQSIYYRQVQLLLQITPFVAKHDCFALKGGTAINLFVRDFPRLSVDMDLVFLPMMERDDALTSIKTNLNTLASSIETTLPVRVVRAFQEKTDALRLLVERNGFQIKIELSPVLRGTVYEPKIHSVSEAVEAEFGYAEMAVVSFADLLETARVQLVDNIHSLLTLQERQFLLSFKRLQPDWSLLGIEGIEQLPAVRWKMRNLSKMSAIKHAAACDRLSSILGLA